MRLVVILFCCCFLSNVFAQKALKRDKQQTTFFYTQVNLHGGYLSNGSFERLDFSDRGPANQVTFQIFSRNQRNLQRGYVKTVSLAAYKVRFTIPMEKTVFNSGFKTAELNLRMLDTWIRMDTKWDRTSIWIGNKSIPYGHNPKIDPASSFMTNLIKMDIGFAQDAGLFLKTPLAGNRDLEFSCTSGGFFRAPLVKCENLINSEGTIAQGPQIVLPKLKYENTWLITTRLGNPTFNKTEIGLIALSGKIYNALIPNDLIVVNRLGMDMVHKKNEKLRIGRQLMLGHTASQNGLNFMGLNLQTNADLFFENKFIISTSFALNYHNAIGYNLYRLNYTTANSLTYRISVHTRLRLNLYYSKVIEQDRTDYGALLQLVSGIGKRP